MNKEEIIEEITDFVAKHEIIISKDMREKDIDARFTTFGSRASVKAIYDIVSNLDKKTQEEIIKIMKNKKI